MNKNVVYVATAVAMVFTACTNDEYLGVVETEQEQLTEISFAGKNGPLTRALQNDAAAIALNNKFVVVGYKNMPNGESGTEAKVVFDKYTVKYPSTGDTKSWYYYAASGTTDSDLSDQYVKYWDYAASSYDFIAYSTTTGNATVSAVNWANLTSGAYTIEGTVENLGKCYISDKNNVAKSSYGNTTTNTTTNTPVTLTFHKLTPQVRMALYETVNGYSVKDVKFYEGATNNTTTGTATLFAASSFNYDGGVYTIKFTSGDNGTASATYDNNGGTGSYTASATQTFGTVQYSSGLLSTSSSSPSYCGTSDYYVPVLPLNTGVDLTLKMDYTLLADDGNGEEIDIKGATVTIDKQYTAWTYGYAYTYKFNITEKSGYTGDGTDKLTEIVFSAEVEDLAAGTIAENSATEYEVGSTNATAPARR